MKPSAQHGNRTPTLVWRIRSAERGDAERITVRTITMDRLFALCCSQSELKR